MKRLFSPKSMTSALPCEAQVMKTGDSSGGVFDDFGDVGCPGGEVVDGHVAGRVLFVPCGIAEEEVEELHLVLFAVLKLLIEAGEGPCAFVWFDIAKAGAAGAHVGDADFGHLGNPAFELLGGLVAGTDAEGTEGGAGNLPVEGGGEKCQGGEKFHHIRPWDTMRPPDLLQFRGEGDF